MPKIAMSAALSSLLLAGSAAAQMAPSPMPMHDERPATCPATPPRLAPELAGWTGTASLSAAATAQELGAATLTIGAAATATLRPAAAIAYPLAPEHPAAPTGNGGLFAFEVTQAGRYRVALGAGAWIDVVKDGRASQTSAHGHGPDCTGIRKMVDYQLQPGRYTLQVSGAPAPTLRIMVARLAV